MQKPMWARGGRCPVPAAPAAEEEDDDDDDEEEEEEEEEEELASKSHETSVWKHMRSVSTSFQLTSVPRKPTTMRLRCRSRQMTACVSVELTSMKHTGSPRGSDPRPLSGELVREEADASEAAAVAPAAEPLAERGASDDGANSVLMSSSVSMAAWNASARLRSNVHRCMGL